MVNGTVVQQLVCFRESPNRKIKCQSLPSRVHSWALRAKQTQGKVLGGLSFKNVTNELSSSVNISCPKTSIELKNPHKNTISSIFEITRKESNSITQRTPTLAICYLLFTISVYHSFFIKIFFLFPYCCAPKTLTFLNLKINACSQKLLLICIYNSKFASRYYRKRDILSDLII